ncbi:YraN family protein [Pseudarthrobacter sp. J1738]|uniref:YraN family protein n=1 Tax=unclassified Pseudarthrobacter TaxID=2647000 RepID=UPI003D2BBB5E
MRAKDILGQRGEEIAASYLEQHGIRVIDQNWRCPAGEIDIVAVDGDTLVIAEVKTRRNLDYGHPFEAVTPAKLARLHRLAREWAHSNALHLPLRRLDAIAVMDDGESDPIIEHLKGVG